MFDIASKLGLDLTPYLDFDKYQVNEILNGMVSQIDYKIYAKPEISAWQMEALRKCLELGYDVNVDESWIQLRKKYLSRDILVAKRRERDLWVKRGVVVGINLNNYSLWQLRCIWWGVKLGLDIAPLLNPQLGSAKSVLLLENMIDCIHNTDVDYTKYHIDTLRLMRKVALDGDDPNYLRIAHIQPSKANILYEGRKHGIDMVPYFEDFDSCQMDMILYGLINDLDISKYTYKNYESRKMQAIITFLEKGIDTSWVDESTPWFDSRFRG